MKQGFQGITYGFSECEGSVRLKVFLYAVRIGVQRVGTNGGRKQDQKVGTSLHGGSAVTVGSGEN